jgi:hypothetical protein
VCQIYWVKYIVGPGCIIIWKYRKRLVDQMIEERKEAKTWQDMLISFKSQFHDRSAMNKLWFADMEEKHVQRERDP